MLSSFATFSQNRLHLTMQREKSERSIRDIISSHENEWFAGCFVPSQFRTVGVSSREVSSHINRGS